MMVTADKQRIEQVFVNLIDNAIKYSPGSHAIYVGMADEDQHIQITVRDEGIGMDANQQKGLFTRFYRVQDGAANIPGLGLGLYLSKQIIDEHDGELTCHSELGSGSEFTVILPKER